MSQTPQGYREPYERVTFDDHTAWIIIAATLGVVYSVIFLGFRVFIRRTSGLGRLSVDDVVVIAGTILALMQSATVLAACNDGLGKRWSTLSSEMQRRVQQMIYATNLLFIVALGVSKISVSLFLSNLTANRSQRRIFTAVTVGVGVWMVASFLALALQCDISSAWKTFDKACQGSGARWRAISALDITTEVMTVFLAAYLVWNVQITTSRKLTVISSFATRLATIVPTAFRLATFSEDALSMNPTFQAQFQVWLQVGMHASLITTTILVLRPVIYNLNTNYGALGPMISQEYGTGSKTSYVMSNLSGVGISRSEDTRLEQSLTEPQGISSAASAGGVRVSAPKKNAETESVESANSQRMIIKKETTWTIETR